ncbi:MAG TPA: HAD hydrolase-like protein, partial [Ferruginibacter sp.]|nr:HAD hydrolase-like protein [Ferruginibacter sp.]
MIETAFIFDMNGTMINDMHFHEEAWHKILTEKLGAKMSREQTKEQMYGKNEELLERVFGKDKFTWEEMHALSLEKEMTISEGIPV